MPVDPTVVVLPEPHEYSWRDGTSGNCEDQVVLAIIAL